ncbi:MAG: fibronectin type III domain-containing protein [Candidatus Dojkabacteria bacterium]
MHLTPYQKRQLKIVVALVIGIPLTIFAVYQGIQYLSKASADVTPQDVVITNLTTNSLTVTWFTQSATDGYVIPLLNGVEQSPVRDKRGSGRRTSHYVELRALEPSSKYSFTIVSGGSKYTNSSGINYEFTTAPVGTETPIPNPIHGTVTGISNDDVVVYVFSKNKSTYPVSTTTPSGGNWIVDLSSLRKISDKSIVKITDDTELLLMAKNSTGKGAVLEGSYSSLFDSNGKLNRTLSLAVGDLGDLISYFPDESRLGAKVIDKPEPKPPVVIKPPTTPTQDTDREDTVIDRDYQIVHDLRWVDMVTGQATSNLQSGESTVLITNLTDVGFTVVWRSPQKVDGYIKYGTSKTSLTEEVWDVRDGLSNRGTYYAHSVESKRIDPDTTYYFTIYSGEDIYNNSGSMYSVTTLPTLSSPPPFETRSGSLEKISTPGDWIVIAQIVDDDEAGTLGSSKLMSTIPDDNGYWILTVGDTRSEDGSTYFSFSNADILNIYFLGAKEKLFEFPMSLSEINLDTSAVDSTVVENSVKLLSDYGIVNIK